jgi:type VI secretion system protein ImpM
MFDRSEAQRPDAERSCPPAGSATPEVPAQDVPGDTDSGVIAGWYGKLPTLGDFASRRLPAAFISIWDDWLCARLAHSRAVLGEHWLDLYLTCPVWRFFTMPGALGPELPGCWAGVLMPSVDRVGRHFPLTIAAPIERAPLRRTEIDALWQWLHAIEQIALVTLECDHLTDELDERLTQNRLPACVSADADVGAAQRLPALLHVPPGSSLADALADGFAHLWRAAAHDISLWSCVPVDAEATAQPLAVLTARGLPDDAMFVSMLTGTGP